MKALLEFAKTSIIGGFFVLLPLLFFFMLFDELLGVVVLMATPIADALPAEWLALIKEPVFVAVILIGITSFALGLVARLGMARSAGEWLERHTLCQLPLYNTVKGFSRQLAGSEETENFKPVLLWTSEDRRILALLVEPLNEDMAIVLIPTAPLAMSGRIEVVPVNRLEYLSVSLGRYTGIISEMGFGLGEVLNDETSGRVGSQPAAVPTVRERE